MTSIRAAGPDDAPALAALHRRVWVETYGAVAPPEAVEKLSEAHRLAQWRAMLAEPAPFGAALTADGAGLVAWGGPRHDRHEGRGEIRHLYVAPGARMAGHGRALAEHALAAIRAAGLPGAALSVFTDNYDARRFWYRLGGVETQERFLDDGPLWKSANRLVVWDF